MKKLLYIFIFSLAAFSLGSCSSKTTCNKILDAAKDGNLYNTFTGKQMINADYYYDYFGDDPSEYNSTRFSKTFYIPQYFDSYKFLSKSKIRRVPLHTTMDLKIIGKPGESIYQEMKKFCLDKDDNAWIENEIVYYVDGKIETQRLEYLIKKGGTRFRQSFLCVKKDGDWLIYLAVFEKV